MFKKSPFDQIAEQLKAFADPNRIRIIALLLKGEQTATQLNQEIRVCQPTLSHHMKMLCSTHLVDCRKQGVRCFYRINNNTLRSLGRHMQALADYNEAAEQAAARGEDFPDPPEFDSCFQQANR